MAESTKLQRQKWNKGLAAIMAAYLVLVCIFHWASGEQLHYRTMEVNSVTPKDCAGVMTDGYCVQFEIQQETQLLERISLLIGTYGRENQGNLLLQIFSKEGTLLGESRLPTADLADYVYQDFVFEVPVEVPEDQILVVKVTAQDVPEGQATSLWYGTGIDTGKISVPDLNGSTFITDGIQREGKVCYTSFGRDILWFGAYYWSIAAALGAIIFFYGLWSLKKLSEGRKTLAVRLITLFAQYSFLVRQLVARDFKRKYKRSSLGILWSFLNPLLTMLVQYLVFSTIFKSSIENFIVYLLIGIILFNFFGESVGLGLGSIVDNAHLINKVYMPKTIYPLSRVLSSAINLLISLVPLAIVMAITGVSVNKTVFLAPIGLVCLLIFCLGMSMMLSAAMVFFRDTFFLWNVVATLWMYLTPTFYPIDIIPDAWLPIYKLNPMYQYIAFLRSILLDGTAPAPELYAGCIISAGVMFVVGLVVFRKNQDKFVLYL